MARPRRNKELTTAEKIDVLIKDILANESEIYDAEQKLTSLKDKKRELEESLNQEKLNLLLETMEEKNISLDRAKEIIDNIDWIDPQSIPSF